MSATLTLPGISTEYFTLRSQPSRVGSERQTPSLEQPRVDQGLQVSDLHLITEKTRRVAGAMVTLERIDAGIHDARVQHSAYRGFSVVGLWSHAVSLFRRGFGVTTQQPAIRKQMLESEISQKVNELRRVVEKVIVPSLSDVRTRYRDRTFTKTKETPPALLLVAVPVEKIGKAVSFELLRTAAHAKVVASPSAKEIDGGEARCIVSRRRGEVIETLECAYHRPGKVVVYLNGERQGTMWNDDALKLVSAFADDKPIHLKRKRFTEYSIQ